MKKKVVVLLIAFVMGLCVLCHKPVIINGGKLSTEQMEIVESQAKGLYSSKLPLVPVVVSVEKADGAQVFYTIYYFPFGSVGMSYSVADGYNIEKELSRI